MFYWLSTHLSLNLSLYFHLFIPYLFPSFSKFLFLYSPHFFFFNSLSHTGELLHCFKVKASYLWICHHPLILDNHSPTHYLISVPQLFKKPLHIINFLSFAPSFWWWWHLLRIIEPLVTLSSIEYWFLCVLFQTEVLHYTRKFIIFEHR